jgi:hypothetical protein
MEAIQNGGRKNLPSKLELKEQPDPAGLRPPRTKGSRRPELGSGGVEGLVL